jgi:hypothetical protein
MQLLCYTVENWYACCLWHVNSEGINKKIDNRNKKQKIKIVIAIVVEPAIVVDNDSKEIVKKSI